MGLYFKKLLRPAVIVKIVVWESVLLDIFQVGLLCILISYIKGHHSNNSWKILGDAKSLKYQLVFVSAYLYSQCYS